MIEAGRIITQAGDDITDGVIVVENGRITAIGPAADIERPWDATVVGGPDFVAAPGFVEALSSNGMDRANENLDVTPFLDVRDSIDPVHFFFEDCKRWGITTINVQQGNNTVVAGRGRIVKPVGMTVEEMTVRPSFGYKISFAPKSGKSRATQRQVLRRTFEDFRMELEGMVQDASDEADTARREALAQGRDAEDKDAAGRPMEGDGWKVEGLEKIDRDAIDAKELPLLDMVEGRTHTFIYCGAPMDVQPAIDFAKANGLAKGATLVLDNSCWKAADAIAAAGMSVILDSNLVHIETDPVTEVETETFVPGVFAEKGIPFALASANSTTNSLWFQAALCVAHGMSRTDALAAVTNTPAKLIGLGDQLGSLEVGKLANVLLLTGDPLDMTSYVDKAVVEGSVIYDSATDLRNKHLFEGQAPRGAAAVETEEVEEPSKIDGEK
ncbi:MAG: amidohydrolase family protein [Planctomycetes bacterium]|nr:amidohydrolase family protein [Planctomycetota bacterium]